MTDKPSLRSIAEERKATAERQIRYAGEVGMTNDGPIKELAETVADVVGFTGTIEWDSSKPDGMPRKLLDTSRINALGWTPQISLRDGLTSTYAWYLENVA